MTATHPNHTTHLAHRHAHSRPRDAAGEGQGARDADAADQAAHKVDGARRIQHPRHLCALQGERGGSRVQLEVGRWPSHSE